jgi:putative nucleotidyltransferase with HDIG domain
VDSRYLKLARDIPVMPAVASKVLGMATEGQNVSFRELEDIVKVDQGLTARIMKVANSALYARQREVKDLRTAFTLLGFNTIKSLVLLVTASGMFSRIRATAFYRDHWYHSIMSAFLARSLAVRCRQRELSEDAFLAGIFHDMGRVPLYLGDPEKYDALVVKGNQEGLFMRALEREAFGTDHQELGSALMQQWSFPQLFADTAAEHDSANITSPYKSTIILVTVANILVDRAVRGRLIPPRQEVLDRLLPNTCLTPEDADAFSTGLPELLKDDPLFAQCMQMYGFDSPAATPSAPA